MCLPPLRKSIEMYWAGFSWTEVMLFAGEMRVHQEVCRRYYVHVESTAPIGRWDEDCCIDVYFKAYYVRIWIFKLYCRIILGKKTDVATFFKKLLWNVLITKRKKHRNVQQIIWLTTDTEVSTAIPPNYRAACLFLRLRDSWTHQ